MEVVASLSQGRTAAAQYSLFTYKLVPVIFEPPCTLELSLLFQKSTSLGSILQELCHWQDHRASKS